MEPAAVDVDEDVARQAVVRRRRRFRGAGADVGRRVEREAVERAGLGVEDLLLASAGASAQPPLELLDVDDLLRRDDPARGGEDDRKHAPTSRPPSPRPPVDHTRNCLDTARGEGAGNLQSSTPPCSCAFLET